MSAVTSSVTCLSAKVSLRNSRTQRVAAAKPRAAARRGLVCKAEVTNGNGTFWTRARSLRRSLVVASASRARPRSSVHVCRRADRVSICS